VILLFQQGTFSLIKQDFPLVFGFIKLEPNMLTSLKSVAYLIWRREKNDDKWEEKKTFHYFLLIYRHFFLKMVRQ